MIKSLYDKCVAWAGYKYAKQILAIEAFIESSFFPIPPDVMIVPMVISKKNEFIRIALIATIFSVLGALFGYYIGYSLNEVAIKIFEFYGYEYSDAFKEKFSTGGGLVAWLGILFTAGFTPLPFKLLTISSGIIHYNLITFISICIITRGLRFFLVAYLTHKFGQKIGPFLEKQGTKLSIIIAGIVILLAMAIYFLSFK
ncbi:MAG: YqaA family protein [Pelagibacteraceae bacterium]|jgi:membrane protein YqaA with SNARE-associated domain|nr:YqaA family protein [Pelagibacteraceae bacterium]MDP6709841.1 YqaA family protein [Pelagibacteraceae bacterium]|tara:strand:- start:38 stop:634 length:597 start_codon:yes stop_codon:yes gene_type:complete